MLAVRLASAALLAIALVPAVAPAGAAADPARALALVKPTRPVLAREFETRTPDGGPLRLADFKGKVVFLNFWATWCEPCKEELPAMQRLWQRYRERGLVVLAVAADSAAPGHVAAFLKQHGLTFPVAHDPRLTVAGLYKVWALPSTFIIDRNGHEAYLATGSREWDGPSARALLESLLRH